MSQPLTAAQFEEACNTLRSAITSLTSCHDNEVPGEARIARSWLAIVREAALLRRNARLDERRNDLIKRCEALLARREPAGA